MKNSGGIKVREMRKLRKCLTLLAVLVLLAINMMLNTSCSHGEDEPEVIIKSEVIDEGIDTQVTAKQLPGSNGSESAGIQLSYRSMITVKAETASGRQSAPSHAPSRASSDGDIKTISVDLSAVFHNLDTAIVVNSFDIGEPTYSITYGTNGQRSQGYVTITDSVTYYNVIFEGFSFRYMIENEVAVYDDGYTRAVMPYHRIKNLRDNGFTVEDMDYVLESNSTGEQDVYLRKKIKHSFTIEYNGEDYTMHGNVILKKRIGTHPCIVSSELIDKGISDIDNHRNFTTYKSWAIVKYQYSDNNTRYDTLKIEMRGQLDGVLYGSKVLQSADVSLISARVEDVSEHYTYDLGYFTMSEESRNIIIKYNLFTLTHNLTLSHAHFKDGFIEFDFPELDYTDLKVEYEVEYLENIQDSKYYQYSFFDRITIRFGDAEHRFADNFVILVPK